MVRVMASGVFDIIHTGHISYLEQAKAAGDELVVVVACDSTVRKRKHEPITPETMRCRIVSAVSAGDKILYEKKKQKLAPGEMETVELTEAMIKEALELGGEITLMLV